MTDDAFDRRLQQIKDARLGPDDIGNAYRVIARKRDRAPVA